MKKNLFMIAMLAIAAMFAACGPEEKEVVTGLTVTPGELTLAEGESFKLTAKLAPEGVMATGTIEWSSSDTLVAIVDTRGTVTAQYGGEATITAKYGEFESSCKVTVKSFLETIQFTKALLYDFDSTYFADPATGVIPIDTIKASDQTQYLVHRVMVEMWVCSEGFFVNNDGYFDGSDQAAIATFYAPMYYAPGVLNNSERDTYFSLGGWYVASAEEAAEYSTMVGVAGSVNERPYFETITNFWEAYFNDETQAASGFMKSASDYFSGAKLSQWTYDAAGDGYSHSYIPDALVTAGQFYFNTDETYKYMYKLDYAAMEAKVLGGTWGFGYELDIDTVANTWELLPGLTFEKTLTYEQGTWPAANSKKYEPMHACILKKDAPEVAERLANSAKFNFRKAK